MRNLKKVLSLALALVMLLGMMVVGAGAATDYTDADQISNLQAAEVADALGIIEGNAGQFMPTTELDRAQAAQIIARMMLTPEVAKTLKATGNEFSDTQGHWAAAAIGYCAQNGIVEGNGAGSFFPDTKVTGYQFAKMLLVALGYDAKVEGYNGSGWRTNVAIDALQAGLTQNVQVSDTVLTRDAAVQMVLNCLTADMVYYELKTENFGLVRPLANDKVKGDYRYYNENTGVNSGSGTSTPTNNGDTTMQFCELHFPQLKLIEDDVDVWGNIVASWKIVKGNTTETISQTDVTYAQRYTALTTRGKVYSDLGMTGSHETELFIDGQSLGKITLSSSADPIVVGGNGAVTTVWTDNRGDAVRITVVNTYVGDVAGVNADGTVTVSPRLAGEKVGTIKTTGLAIGDAVLYTRTARGAIITAEKVEPITGTLTAFTDRTESGVEGLTRTVKVNGNTTLGTDTAEYSDKVASKAVKDSLTRTVSVIKDNYGYILYVSENAGVADYAYVIDIKAHPIRDDVNQAVVATKTGAVETWLVTNDVANLSNRLVSYTSSGGVYTLAGETYKPDGTVDVAGIVKCEAANTSSTAGPNNLILTTKGNRLVHVTGAIDKYADSTTVFIVRRGLNSFETFVGIANVPTMAVAATKAVDTAAILDTTNGNIVKAVYIDARADVSFNGSMEDVVYILRQNRVEGNAAEGWYYGVYSAVVNGAIDHNFKANLGLTPERLYTYTTYNPTTGVTSVDTSSVGDYVNGTVAVENNSVTLGHNTANEIGGFTFNSLTRVYVVDENKNLYSYSITNVPTTDKDKVWYADVAGVLSLLVIEKGAATVVEPPKPQTSGAYSIDLDSAGDGTNAVNIVVLSSATDAEKTTNAMLNAILAEIEKQTGGKASAAYDTTSQEWTITAVNGAITYSYTWDPSGGASANGVTVNVVTASGTVAKVVDSSALISTLGAGTYAKVTPAAGGAATFTATTGPVTAGATYELGYYDIAFTAVSDATLTTTTKKFNVTATSTNGALGTGGADGVPAGKFLVKATDTITVTIENTEVTATGKTTTVTIGLQTADASARIGEAASYATDTAVNTKKTVTVTGFSAGSNTISITANEA